MRTMKVGSNVAIASLLSLFLLLAVAVGTASAHAKVIDSNPKMGSTIAQAPKTITVTTAENMKPGAQNSNMFVYGPAGDLVSQGNATIPLNSPKTMSVNLKDAGKGVYIVRWNTVSADDGDPDQGAFTFTVGAATSSITSAASSGQQTTPAATASSSSTASSGTPIWVSAVIGLITLLLGLSIGMGIGRRSSAAAASSAVPAPVPSTKDSTNK